jgi:hypothetical protein
MIQQSASSSMMPGGYFSYSNADMNQFKPDREKASQLKL